MTACPECGAALVLVGRSLLCPDSTCPWLPATTQLVGEPPKRGRPSACGHCGRCERCQRNARSRAWWESQPPAKKRAILDARPADRRQGRKPGPRAPEKERARWTVKNALRYGLLAKQPCEVCGVEKVDAHHEDYSRPLDVRWLCRRHHAAEHRVYNADAVAAG
jgi:hypothetical protein